MSFSIRLRFAALSAAVVLVLSACTAPMTLDAGADAQTAEDIPTGADRPSAFDVPADARPGCLPTIESIQQEIFVPKCTNGRCHGSDRPVLGLDLASANVAGRLVNRGADCAGQTLVVPGNANGSFLFAKVSEVMPRCGNPMPTGGPALLPGELQCIAQWIASLAPPDAGTQDVSDARSDVPNADVPTCAMGQIMCAGRCVDTQTDSAHCGACAMACPMGNVCVAGACRCPGAQLSCGGSCVDAQNNVNHCGACNNACSPGQNCVNGSCVCMGALQSCGGSCVDVQANAMHCGGCNQPCGVGLICAAGRCVRVCAPGQVECNAACVDTGTSNEHCGACNNRCPAGQSCSAGRCVCPVGTTLCGGTCVDTNSNASHCGACNNVCGAGRACSMGRCNCVAPTIDCGGSCVDPRSNTNHCGMCNNRCAFGASCSASVCTCPPGQTACNGSCTDTQVDNFNCGGCNNFCPIGQSCMGGACRCPPGLTLCGGSCVDTNNDDGNCGGCNAVCGNGRMCLSGACSLCGAPVESYRASIAPHLDSNCASCHGGAFPSGGVDLSLANSYRQLVNVAANGCAMRARVTPGNANASDLVHKLTGVGMCGGSRMPLGDPPWTDAEVTQLRRWICQGALNN